MMGIPVDDEFRPREQCGVFAVYGDSRAAELTHYALYALQHRGQESAGIAASKDGAIRCHRGMGLVSEVFDRHILEDLGDGATAAIGHVRYSTTGDTNLANAQPLKIRFIGGDLALAHNGNLVNAGELRRGLEEQGSIFQTTLDTEVVAHLVARKGGLPVVEAIAHSLSLCEGGYALVFLTPQAVMAARDPNGIRPLSLGRLGKAWVVASETCAFDTIGASFERDLDPGELLIIDNSGPRSVTFKKPGELRLCIFEYIYFARPDSDLHGLNVHAARKRLGRRLAQDFPVDADLVTGVPDSSISAASGYAEASGIPYEMGLIKNRYIGRTFIQPKQEMRDLGVHLKLNPLRSLVRGKRIVLVDDSIVRGTTSRHIVSLLRDAGAEEVHLRISSPPYRYPCHFGIDTRARSELIAAFKEPEEIEGIVGADSLRYLSLDAMIEAVGCGRRDFCVSCFDGDYPVRIPEGVGKRMFEST